MKLLLLLFLPLFAFAQVNELTELADRIKRLEQQNASHLEINKAFQAQQQLIEILSLSKAEEAYQAMLDGRLVDFSHRFLCPRMSTDKECIQLGIKDALIALADFTGQAEIEVKTKIIDNRSQQGFAIEANQQFEQHADLTTRAEFSEYQLIASELIYEAQSKIALLTLQALKGGSGNAALKQKLINQYRDVYQSLGYVPSQFRANQLQRQILIGNQLITLQSIPEGEFVFGSDYGDANERPISRRKVSEFWLASRETSSGLYQLCIDALACSKLTQTLGSDAPIHSVNLDNIVDEFLPWLKEQSGLDFRLPTEVEWEYAAKEGLPIQYSTEPCDYATAKSRDFPNCTITHIEALSSANKLPNRFGLFDMYGNLAEWTGSCYFRQHTNESRAKANCALYVIKSGSWYGNLYQARPSARTGKASNVSLDTLGFRLALDVI